MEKEGEWVRRHVFNTDRVCLSSDQSFTETYYQPYLKSTPPTHRQDEAGRHLQRLPSPTPCPEQVPQDCVQSGFEYLQGWGLHSPSGKPVSVFAFNIKTSVALTRNMMSFGLRLLVPAQSVGTTEESLVPSVFPPIKYLHAPVRSP